MANTYSKIYIHCLFAVKFRESLIQTEWEDKLHSVIGNLINESGGKSILVNGVEDHVHCFFHGKPSVSISDMMKITKAKSSKWINEQRFSKQRFEWQKGFGCFSYGQSQRNDVYQYIKNQKEHHKKMSFQDEYIQLLNAFEIDFEEAYIFSEPE